MAFDLTQLPFKDHPMFRPDPYDDEEEENRDDDEED